MGMYENFRDRMQALDLAKAVLRGAQDFGYEASTVLSDDERTILRTAGYFGADSSEPSNQELLRIAELAKLERLTRERHARESLFD